MVSKFEGKVAVVSGATGDLGQLLCRALIADGAQVIGLDIVEATAEILHESLRAHGVPFRAFRLDVADPEAVDAFIASSDAPPRVDVLINAAGVITFAPMAQTSVTDWDRTFDINVRGAFLLTKGFAPVMQAGGAIVNISSSAALRAGAGWSAYSASKAALVSLSKVAAAELAPGIRVNVVCPGGLNTKMPHRLLEGHPEKQQILGEMALASMLKRLGEASEVVPVCLFLASADASLITGAMIPVDGGMTAW